MSLDGQRADPERYALVPRTLTFLFQADQVLLLKVNRGGWAGLYNGIGGHLERGEDPLTAADRELREETGLNSVNQRLAGVVTVDTGTTPGIGLFVFVGQADPAAVLSGPAGTLEWVPLSEIEHLPHVQDLSFLIAHAVKSQQDGGLFFAAYRYSPSGELVISKGPS